MSYLNTFLQNTGSNSTNNEGMLGKRTQVTDELKEEGRIYMNSYLGLYSTYYAYTFNNTF